MNVFNFMRGFVICSAVLCAGRLPAAIISYTDRTSFDAAAGVTTSEDFNSYVADVPFHTVPLDVGDFTISMIGAPSTDADRNKIDIPPADYAVFNVDGTPLMNVLTFLPDSLFLTFDFAITAFGADFGGFNNNVLRTNIIVNGAAISPPVTVGDTVRFFGFVSDTPFTSIEFQAINPLASDGYGIDNVAYVSAVPEPTGLTLVTAGLLAFAAAKLRRRQREAA